MKYKWLKYVFAILFPLVLHSQVVEKSLTQCKWKFKKKQEEKWYKATVPGTVHTDLFANKLIPDPFYGNNEKQLQWIENEDWEYRTTFKLSKKELLQSHIELQFDGLDTYAKVYLNDSLILFADNMFRSWNVDVKKYIHEGENKLNILFESAVKKGKEVAKKLPYTLPGDEKVFTRKAQYQYGWDWGPRFVTCGIWKDVKLVLWNDAKILNIQSVQRSLTDSLAELEFVCEIKSDVDANAYLDIINVGIGLDGQITNKIALKKGVSRYAFSYIIKNPQRWWCNGLGFATIYNFEIDLTYNSKSLDEKKVAIGLRTIELIQDKDSIGSSFYFKLNGVPVFMKGANYIPSDNFLPRITNDDYEKVVKNAVHANMNMLRVWGGGVYADDEFYDQCDRNGILVWQDLMFACAMYPGDDHFTENVKEEVTQQVGRLRNHPCIALWCGNNEVDEGWKNWDWQKQYHYSEKDSAKIWSDYTNLFHKVIPDIITKEAGGVIYYPSSPSIGWGHKESLQQGDSHYWGVWWGNEPFEMYEKKAGRFVSEYGFQGMPDLNTMYQMGAFKERKKGDILYEDEYYSDDYSHKLDSIGFKSHQKSSVGYQTIKTYMARDYKVPETIENFSYVSQLLQAEGMQIAIEAHRRAKPYCMGTLYWQLNDCWPVTSWSTIDYYNNWKASHYQVKRSYKDVIISIKENKDSCDVYIVSDLRQKEKAELHIELDDFFGNILWSHILLVVIDSNSSKIYYHFDRSLLRGYDEKSILLKCSLKQSDNYTSDASSIHYFVKPKDLQLIKPQFNIAEDICEQVQCFTLSSDVLMKDVCVSIEGETINLSDNYFDLLPGEGKIIYLPRHVRVKHLVKKVKIKSLIDTY